MAQLGTTLSFGARRDLQPTSRDHKLARAQVGRRAEARSRQRPALGVHTHDGDVCERYGVWVEKNMYGRKYMGIERATFLIDAEGRIAEVWRKVKVKGHVEAVLDAVKAL